MAQASIPYAVARTRVLEARLINEDRLKRMLDATDYESVKRALAEAGYSESDADDYEGMISREIEQAYTYVRDVTPNKAATDVFMLKNDCYNLKSLLKAKLLGGGREAQLLNTGTASAEHAQAAIAGGEYFRLPENMAQAAAELVQQIDAGTADAQGIDLVMDGACYADMHALAAESKDKLVIEYAAAQTDMANLMTFLRIRKAEGHADALEKALLPGGTVGNDKFMAALSSADDAIYRQLGMEKYQDVVLPGMEEYTKTGSLSRMERLADDYITGLFKAHRYDNFSIAPLLGYLMAKERETQAVRLIMVGKLNSVPHDMVMERLRGLYE